MKAVIMAGGFGTRIQPLTINLPKPMIPLANRPIMGHIVDLLKSHGFTELVMLLYHQPEVIKNFFGDGSEVGMRITYVTPLEDLGTAGAVKAAAKYLDETFLVISGDLMTDFDLSQVLRFHRERQAQATITLTSVPDPLQFGVVITDQEGRINKFLEKPGWGEVFSDTINTGIYILEPEILDLIPEGQNRDWSKDIFPRMLEDQAPLFGYNMTGYWADIGNTDAYLEACRDLTRGRIALRMDEDLEVLQDKKVLLGNEAKVAQGDYDLLEGMVIVGDNTLIHPGAKLKNCLIGRNCIIEEGAELEEAILWDNVYLKRNARIQGAVLCNNVRLGQGVTIEPGVVVADETTVGDEAFLKRDVKIWPRKVIENGAIVTTNLIWGEKWRKSLFEGSVVRGLTNIELTPEFTAKLGAAYASSLPKDAYVLAGRDAIRASRMLKRSFVGGMLSAGVNVRDAKMVSLPVLRHKLETFGEVGGVHFRQSPDDIAATEILFCDAEGNELSSGMAKNIERIYFKENFRRVHFSEPGGIFEIPRIYDFYQESFLMALDQESLRKAAPKVVVDMNHSPAGNLLPKLLNQLGCDVIELNSNVVESRVGFTQVQEEKAMTQLSRIVATLEATAGIWLGPSGERLSLIDEQGEVLSDFEALLSLTALVCHAEGQGSLVMPVPAPQVVEELAGKAGMTLQRTKVDGRSIVEAAKGRGVKMAATMDGRFAFPSFQPHFDALFTTAKTLELLVRTGNTLSEVRRKVPARAYRQAQVPCSREWKGGIMRKMSEDSVNLEASFIDGVKVHWNEDWVLVLPDQHRPVVHIIAEAAETGTADQLLERYRNKVEQWKLELITP